MTDTGPVFGRLSCSRTSDILRPAASRLLFWRIPLCLSWQATFFPCLIQPTLSHCIYKNIVYSSATKCNLSLLETTIFSPCTKLRGNVWQLRVLTAPDVDIAVFIVCRQISRKMHYPAS